MNRSCIIAYYNAGSAALVLIVIALAIGGGLYIRNRRRNGSVKLAADRERDEEESIPLSRSVGGAGDGERGGYTPVGETDHVHERRIGNGKGKEKAIEEPLTSEAIFDVGDSDDENENRADSR